MKEVYIVALICVITAGISIGTAVTRRSNIERGNPFHEGNAVYQCTKLYEVSLDKVQHKTNKRNTLLSSKRTRKLPSSWDSRNLETM